MSDCTTDDSKPTKRCVKCGDIKDRGAFRKSANNKDGLQVYCKVCSTAIDATYRAAHKNDIAARNAVYRALHRDEIAVRDAAYYASHREKIRLHRETRREERSAYRAAYYAAHREKQAAYDAIYRQSNPDKTRAKKNRRRARKQGNGGTHTDADIQRQGEIQNWKCWWRMPGCAVDVKDDYHVDHLVPLSKGGHNDPSNIVISCPHCNCSKSNKTPDEWAGRLL